MKKKKIISVIAVFAIVLAMLTGCGSDPVKDDLTNYITKQMPAATELGKSITSGFNSVAAANYIDDKTMLLKLKDEVIPNSNKLIETAKAITSKTKELGAIHEKYVAAITKQNSGFTMLQTALEKSDADMAKKANDLLIEADTQSKNYVAEVNAFAKEHGMEIK